MESISAFEIIKTGIGPSSSHTMGPWRAAALFLADLDSRGLLDEVNRVTVHLYGSLAKTGRGHGTDIAVLMGLSGYDYTTLPAGFVLPAAETIRQSDSLLLGGKRPLTFRYLNDLIWEPEISLPEHANGMTFHAWTDGGKVFSETYFSVGGGFVARAQQPDPSSTKVISTPYPCHSGADLLKTCRTLRLSISQLTRVNEQAWRTADEISQRSAELWTEIRACIFRGLSTEGFLPGGLQVKRRAPDLCLSLLGTGLPATPDDLFAEIRKQPADFRTVTKWISCFALAVNEENASFGRVVTAPTNGAAGVLPAVLMYAWCFTPDLSGEKITDFILTAGEIGTLFKKNATISAAMGGCQAEIGVSSAMAAAALTEISGGSPDQVLQAAEIAMEHHLGLTCDPIGGLVQIPCIERNSMGAMKAITASQLALESDPAAARVSLDAVIKTMWETARDMNSRYKETSEGGLAAHIPVNVPEC